MPKRHPSPSDEGLVIPLERLQLFKDEICLRDPRGKSLRPALRPLWRAGCLHGFEVQGPFTVLQRFDITPGEGRAFVETSRDENPIHTEDTVVSGAMTTSRLLLLPEALLSSFAVDSIRLKFRAFSRYGHPTVNRFTVSPEAGGKLRCDLEVLQEGVTVAEGTLKGSKRRLVESCAPRRGLPLPPEELLRTWLESLRLRPDLTLATLGPGYPRAFLASLPSGEMVRNGGAGGLLNAIDFEFPEEGVPPLVAEASPTVEVETGRPRNAFRRVLTTVAQGMVTYCRGYATVLLGMLSGAREQAGPAVSPATP